MKYSLSVKICFLILFFFQEIVSGHLGVDGQNVLRAVGVELDNEQGGWQDVQKMVATDVLEEVGQQNHVLWEKHVQVSWNRYWCNF